MGKGGQLEIKELFFSLFLLEVSILLYRKTKWQKKMLKFWRTGSDGKVVFCS